MDFKSTASRIAIPAANAGKGAVAGVLATAAMTISSTIEMRLEDREPSSVPASAAGKVLGVQPRNPEGEARFAKFVHWSYGAGWGSLGGLLRTIVPEPIASVAHLASVWGAEATMLPALDVVPPVSKWSAKQIALDVFHHAVYAAAFAGAWYLLDKSEEPRSLVDSLWHRVR